MFFLTLISFNSYCQDIILKRDGTELNTKILEVGTTQIKFKHFDYLTGPSVIIEKSSVFSIKYENGKKEVFKEESSENLALVTRTVNSLGTITTSEGEEIKAKIIEISENEIKYKRQDYLSGPMISFPKSEIFCITYLDGRKETFGDENAVELPSLDKIQFYNGTRIKVAGLYIPKNEEDKKHATTYTNSNKNLSSFKNITIMFSGQSAMKCFSGGECFDLEKKYKSSIHTIMQEKMANDYFLANFYDYKLGPPEKFSNSIILEYKFLLASYAFNKKDRSTRPDFVIYQLNILSPNGKIITSYFQYIYLHSALYMSTLAALENKDEIYTIYMLCTMNYAFSSLLNQFLNDGYGQSAAIKYLEMQKNSVSEKNYNEFSKAQTRLFEIVQNKKILVQELSGLGVKIENISDGKTLIDAGMVQSTIHLSDPTGKLANYTDAAQIGVTFINLIAANNEKRKLEEKKALVNKLQKSYQDLVFEEESISRNLNNELTNSAAIELFPNNPELNKSVEKYLNDIKQKTAQASNNINSEFSQTTQDILTLANEIKIHEEQKNAAKNADNKGNAQTNTGGTYNAAAAKQCSQKTEDEWKRSEEYQKWDKSNKSMTTFSQADAYMATYMKCKLTLQNCGSMLPEKDIALITKMMNDSYQTAQQLKSK